IDVSADEDTLKRSMDRQMLLKQEVTMKIEQLETTASLYNAKYLAEDAVLPSDLQDALDQMRALERSFEEKLDEKEQTLAKAQEHQSVLEDTKQIMSEWLDQADDVLSAPVTQVETALEKHEALKKEFDIVQHKIETLEDVTSEVVAELTHPEAAQAIQTSVDEIKERWLAVQIATEQRITQIQETVELWEKYESLLYFVTSWLETSHAVASADVVWMSQETIDLQVQQHKAQLEELPKVQENLTEMSATLEKLQPLCSIEPAQSKMVTTSQEVTVVSEKLHEQAESLEETVAELETYGNELNEVTQWLEETRDALKARDTTLTLKEQLAMQEKLYGDIEAHRSQAFSVLSQHSELRSIAGEDSPTHSTKLASEISQLTQVAQDKLTELRDLVRAQETCEDEICELTGKIAEAQQKMSVSSMEKPKSQSQLKQQLADNNALAAEVKEYQERIEELAQKSSHISERGRQLSPPPGHRQRDTGSELSMDIPDRKDSGFMSPDGSIRSGVSVKSKEDILGGSGTATSPLVAHSNTGAPSIDTTDSTVSPSIGALDPTVTPSFGALDPSAPLTVSVTDEIVIGADSPNSVQSNDTDELLQQLVDAAEKTADDLNESDLDSPNLSGSPSPLGSRLPHYGAKEKYHEDTTKPLEQPDTYTVIEEYEIEEKILGEVVRYKD
ncbi:unnamed protein product, partial [Owenia fusiformis]